MNDQSITDQNLAIQARQDSNAFIMLYQRHVKSVFAYPTWQEWHLLLQIHV